MVWSQKDDNKFQWFVNLGLFESGLILSKSYEIDYKLNKYDLQAHSRYHYLRKTVEWRI